MNVIDVSKVINEERKTICFTGHRPNKLVGYTSRIYDFDGEVLGYFSAYSSTSKSFIFHYSDIED